MAIWNNIHVFGYGESQMVGPDKNGKVANDELTTIAPLISYLASLQQPDTDISMGKLYALNIFNGRFIDFLPNDGSEGNKLQRFPMGTLDQGVINDLADELSNALP